MSKRKITSVAFYSPSNKPVGRQLQRALELFEDFCKKNTLTIDSNVVADVQPDLFGGFTKIVARAWTK